MTPVNKQMYDDFQLVYNNLASNLAPGLDIFEISMYLTKAYFSFVEGMYNQYEKSESARKALIDLVNTIRLNPYTFPNSAAVRITDKSTFFKLPDNVLHVVYEAVTLNGKAQKCLRDKTLSVIPITHDTFEQVHENPFRFNNRHALRLDVDVPAIGRLAEIVTVDPNVSQYYIRYIRKPSPIILESLTGDDRIEGLQTETECELNSFYHPDIVRLAAQMAYNDYKAV